MGRRNATMVLGSSGQNTNVVAPSTFAWAANAASINVAGARDFRATNTLAGNSTLTLTGFSDGCFGQIFVQQDATGNRTLTFTIAGRTIVRDLNVNDDNPLGVASSQTIYQYYFYTSPAGVASVSICKLYTQ